MAQKFLTTADEIDSFRDRRRDDRLTRVNQLRVFLYLATNVDKLHQIAGSMAQLGAESVVVEGLHKAATKIDEALYDLQVPVL